jgi:hypothetical protein
MNTLAHILAPELMKTLGLALLHFLWQGAALAAIGAAALAIAHTASARYAAGIATLALMVAAPVVTFVMLQSPAAGFRIATHQVVAVAPVTHVAAPGARAADPILESEFPSSGALLLVVQIWFAGVLLFSLRTAGGLFLVARLRRRDAKPIAGELLAQ